MKAVEFQAQLNSDQTLRVPGSVIGTIPIGQTVRVLVLFLNPILIRSGKNLRPRTSARGTWRLMPSTTSYLPGDLVLVDFPFTTVVRASHALLWSCSIQVTPTLYSPESRPRPRARLSM